MSQYMEIIVDVLSSVLVTANTAVFIWYAFGLPILHWGVALGYVLGFVAINLARRWAYHWIRKRPFAAHASITWKATTGNTAHQEKR